MTSQVAAYMDSGARYVRHADASPSAPGRVITAVLYLNEGWDVKVREGDVATVSDLSLSLISPYSPLFTTVAWRSAGRVP